MMIFVDANSFDIKSDPHVTSDLSHGGCWNNVGILRDSQE